MDPGYQYRRVDGILGDPARNPGNKAIAGKKNILQVSMGYAYIKHCMFSSFFL